jgi:uncharacterized protein YuzE
MISFLDIGQEERIVSIEILNASKHINLERLFPVKYRVSKKSKSEASGCVR